MSLTPSKNDPNRKKELARKKKEPDTFGPQSEEPYPDGWSSSSQHAPVGGKKPAKTSAK